MDTLNLGHAWYPATEAGGQIRDGAWVAEATGLVNLSAWPTGGIVKLFENCCGAVDMRASVRGFYYLAVRFMPLRRP